LLSYTRGRHRGEKVDLPLRTKEEQKAKYERAYRDLKEEIEREENLTIGNPELISLIRFIPEKTDVMVSDEEIERIAMEYERAHAREPEDVSLIQRKI